MRDDLRTAYSMKERAERLLSNLDKLKAEGTVTEAEYETLKPEYIAMLDDALPWVDSLKAELQKELDGREKELERLEKQLSLLRARLKVGEITSETYREKGKPIEDKVKGLQRQISDLEALISCTSSADIGGPKDITLPKPSGKGILGERINVFLTGVLNYCHNLQLMSSKFFARFRTIGKIAKQRPFITSVISICILGLATWGLVTLFNSPVCPKVGDRAPDLVLKNIEGEEVRLSDFRGKIVIVYLWIINCPYCVDDMPYIQAIFDKWGKQNLTVLAINQLDSPDVVKDFIADQDLTVPIFLDREQETVKRYCLGSYVPVTIFIDRKGIIARVEMGAWTYRNQRDRQKIISEIGSILNDIDHSQKFDWTPPIISDVSISSITESSAMISWTTDEPATSMVMLDTCCFDPMFYECGLDCPAVPVGWPPLFGDKQTLVTHHYLVVDGLWPGTKYYVSIYSEDANANESVSIGGTFTTRSPVTCSKINCVAPNLTLQSIDGKIITLNDLQGKKVILNFWISTCGGCDSEMSYIQEIYRKYPKSEIEILAVNVREDASVVSSYALRKGLSFTILLDPEGRVDQIYKPELFPCTFFIGTDGTIQAIKSGAFTSVDEIQSILGGID